MAPSSPRPTDRRGWPRPTLDTSARAAGSVLGRPGLASLIVAATLGCTRTPADTVAPQPIATPRTGLDRMLGLVPLDADFVIIRDPSAVTEYARGTSRFLARPLAVMATNPLIAEMELGGATDFVAELGDNTVLIEEMLSRSGVRLQDGVAVVLDGHGEVLLVLSAPDPSALEQLAKSVLDTTITCEALATRDGFVVCGLTPAAVEAYAPADDPTPLRAMLAQALPGGNLDEANLVVRGDGEPGRGDEIIALVTTPPGQLYVVATQTSSERTPESEASVVPGSADLLDHVEPGAGFVWSRVRNRSLPMGAVGQALMGEESQILVAGSSEPHGIVVRAKLPVAKADLLETFEQGAREELPTSIPALPGSTVTTERVPLERPGGAVEALHVAVTPSPAADGIERSLGLQLDGWVVAQDRSLTMAAGVDAAGMAALLAGPARGPGITRLPGVPPQLAARLRAANVSTIVHLPLDELQSRHMREMFRASSTAFPGTTPDEAAVLLDLFAALSSVTLWMEGPVMHLSVQAIGNQSTEEGRAALDAALAVSQGADPTATFAALRDVYVASPMAPAYAVRSTRDELRRPARSLIGAFFGFVAAMLPLMSDADEP